LLSQSIREYRINFAQASPRLSLARQIEVMRKEFPLTARKLFPGFVAICALSFVSSTLAQTNDLDGRPRVVLTDKISVKPIETKPITVPPASIDERVPLGPAGAGRFNTQLLSAIESHLGASYHYNRTGPESFDCSGFVWRAFQDAGVNFQRGPARSYWATFAAPPKEEEFKFGTLVFFSGLTHVGIVADQKGFYHSARHGGVEYSPFNDYWLSRIDGFRRVPIESLQTPATIAKPRAAKPATSTESVEDEDAP
jgi:cell wall-associated NlpC family hydrolase